MQHRFSLALVAAWVVELAGLKVGYQSELPEFFYFWMRGLSFGEKELKQH